jgi:CxxC motif-containing protein (DUF1111 family)
MVGKQGCWGFFAAMGILTAGGRAGADIKEKAAPVADGYEIFNREWMPNDPRGHGGDGLGPVYNDSSCVACHNSGGSGGAGPASKNIDILSAARNLGVAMTVENTSGQGQKEPGASGNGAAVAPASSAALDALAQMHAGFRASRNVVLHRFGTDPNYDLWRSQLLAPGAAPNPAGASDVLVSEIALNRERLVSVNQRFQAIVAKRSSRPANQAEDSVDAAAEARIQQIRAMVAAASPAFRGPSRTVGEFVVARSQRNPTPLFGIGLIDAIPDAAIEAMAKREAKDSPETQGRLSHVKDGRIGRLGWKGQVASVEDFVLNACAVELGLEVPGHHQSVVPQAPKYRATGLDLSAEDCAALVAYVKSLPKPVERRAFSAEESKVRESGKAMFASIGCARCHAPKLGDVQGIYSDLLLHDMGQDMSDDGSYSESAGDDDEPLVPRIVADAGKNGSGKPPVAQQGPRGATRQEWRTPPLWGFRDSGPYLHDGRAQTLEQAVAMHGGQAATSARKFFRLSPRERLEIEALLKCLVAPPNGVLASR